MGMVFCLSLQSHAQSHKIQSAFDDWRKKITSDFSSFRKECMDEYIGFVRNPWKEFVVEQPVAMPNDEDVKPIIVPESLPVMEENDSNDNNSIPIIIREVVSPVVITPQPEPLLPIKETVLSEDVYHTFSFFGTEAKVRVCQGKKLSLKSLDEQSIADALIWFGDGHCDNTIIDCLKLREQYMLCDWAYLLMLKNMAEQYYGNGSNESVLLMAYIYMQSGYKMRLANDGKRLYMLYASEHYIYNQGFFYIDGDSYYAIEDIPQQAKICRASFPKERPLSLVIDKVPLFAEDYSDARKIDSFRDKTMSIVASVNLNLMNFYSTYPTSSIGGNVCSRWAMYANTPLSEHLKESLYRQIRNSIEGKGQVSSVNTILHWVQTGFKYEYDNNIWGSDRAFFAEETLFYPYCDCEDRSILFARIVRDLLGLKCLLVYYPGHLASAIELTEGNPTGDYLRFEGHDYYIADPTILGFGANVGETMEGMDNTQATVILLE